MAELAGKPTDKFVLPVPAFNVVGLSEPVMRNGGTIDVAICGMYGIQRTCRFFDVLNLGKDVTQLNMHTTLRVRIMK